MAGYTPLFTPGAAVTFRATTDLKGGDVVEVTGDRAVGAAAANSAKVVGIAARDRKSGEDILVYAGGIQRPVASGAIAAGDRVGSAAGGKVATASTNKIGTALTAAADGATVQVRFDA